MKIKLLVIFIGALFLSVSAYSQSSKYFLKGTINRSHDGQLAVLSKMDEKSIVFKTDTTIIEEGSFYFEVKRMTNEIIVSFYNNDVLYMTNKEREYERVPVEILYD